MNVNAIYGPDADLVEGGWPAPPWLILDNLSLLGLDGQESYMLTIMLFDRFSLRGVIRPLKLIATQMGICYRQAQRWLARLRARGLVETDRQPGRSLMINISGALAAIRKLISPATPQPAAHAPIVEEEEEKKRIPAPANDEAASVLLDGLAAQFGEWIQNKPQAMLRVRRAQQRAGWTDDELPEAVQEAATEALHASARRRFAVFFTILERRAKEARIARAEAAEIERINTLHEAISRARWEDHNEPEAQRLAEQLSDAVERQRKKRRRPGLLTTLVAASLGGG